MINTLYNLLYAVLIFSKRKTRHNEENVDYQTVAARIVGMQSNKHVNIALNWVRVLF
jgi:hypothetical protein